jgi:glycosyltransferase involved in cell wall biosynthesis
MRIGIDARLIGGRNTGDRTYWRGLLTGLAKLECTQNDEFILYLSDFPEQSEIDSLSLPANFIWKHIDASSDRLWSISSLPTTAKKDKLDLVHVQYSVSPLFSVPVVTTIHDISFNLFPELFETKDRLILNISTPNAIKKSAAVIGVSESTRQDIIKNYRANPDKVFTTLLAAGDSFKCSSDDQRGLAREHLSEKYKIDSPFVLAVGVLQPRKNLPLLIKAFKTAKTLAQFPHKLVITGKKGWLTEEIESALNGVSESGSPIILTGYVPDSDLPLLYNCADLFCHPAVFEGFGLPPLEAMSCGCPVITANTSSLPEVVGDAGITLDPRNIGAWIDTIVDCLTHPEKLSGMSEKGLKQAQKFSWEETATRTYDIYKKVAKSA